MRIVEGEHDLAVTRERDRERRVRNVMRGRLNAAVAAGAWETAYAVIDHQIEQDPDDLGRLITKLSIAGVGARDPEAVAEIVQQIMESDPATDARRMQSVARMVTDDFPEEARDLGAAERAALKAADLTEHKNAQILATLARVYYLKGDLEAAVETQSKAVSLAPDTVVDRLRTTLEEYKRAAGDG